LYRRAVPGLRLLLRLAPLLLGAFAVAVWLERRRRGQVELIAPRRPPAIEPQSSHLERVPAPEPVDIVTIVDDLLEVGR
jgi:hypothetical protein